MLRWIWWLTRLTITVAILQWIKLYKWENFLPSLSSIMIWLSSPAVTSKSFIIQSSIPLKQHKNVQSVAWSGGKCTPTNYEWIQKSVNIFISFQEFLSCNRDECLHFPVLWLFAFFLKAKYTRSRRRAFMVFY